MVFYFSFYFVLFNEMAGTSDRKYRNLKRTNFDHIRHHTQYKTKTPRRSMGLMHLNSITGWAVKIHFFKFEFKYIF